MHPLDRANKLVKTLEGAKNIDTLESIITKAAEAMNVDAVPLEQLKGDIARAGHPVKQMLALDRDNNRLFFTDKDDQHLVAEFGDKDEGHRIKKIGLQANINKEYDVVDLEPSTESKNPSEVVETGHEEAEVDDESIAGVIPGGTPGDKPEKDDRGFGEALEKSHNKISALIKEMQGEGDCGCSGEHGACACDV